MASSGPDMRAGDLLECLRARLPEEYARAAAQALREEYGGAAEHIPAPDGNGPGLRGERNAKMASLYASGVSVEALAQRFGLSGRAVRKIIKMELKPN